MLVMACVLMGWWVRSFFFYENVRWANERLRTIGILSHDGHIGLVFTHDRSLAANPERSGFSSLSKYPSLQRWVTSLGGWRWYSFGFGHLDWNPPDQKTLEVWFAPYFVHRPPTHPALCVAPALETTARQSEGSAMREFFRGWRRKAGCLTLGLACLFAAGWMRSYSNYETFTFPFGSNNYVQAAFVYKKLIVGRISIKRSGEQANARPQMWVTDPHSEELWTEFAIGGTTSQANPDFVAPHTHSTVSSKGAEYLVDHWFCSVPCWSIVLPLTLLSAWLLLSKQPPVKAKVRP